MSLRSFRSLASLSGAAAKEIFVLSKKAIAERGRFAIVLSGGNTPKTLYETLAREYKTKIDWQHVHIFWGDERYVPHDDQNSNFRMAKESLLSKIAIPGGNIHPIPTSFTNSKDAAASYASELTSFFGQPLPEFDLILLGLGGDGHTASLFPGMSEAEMNNGLVIVTNSPAPPPIRVSLTLPVINNARNVFFLVAGEEKREILKSVLADEGNPFSKYPAARIKPTDETQWFIHFAENSWLEFVSSNKASRIQGF